MPRSHPDHAHWHGNIGQPIAIDVAAPIEDDAQDLDVLSWNLAIGNGRLVEVVEKIRAGVFDGVQRPDTRPLVILAQEGYRSDPSVPERPSSNHHGGKDPRTPRLDIVDVADALGLSLRYAPSMRNGRHRSDRGNAILSNVAIASARSFALPHVRQMRIALAAELESLPWLTFACAHLDTRGRVRLGGQSALANAPGRVAQAAALGKRLVTDAGKEQTIIVGADLNSYFGVREPMFRGLISAGFQRIPHTPLGAHTFHSTPIRMLLDHILVRGAALRSIAVMRLDENGRDRGPIFGSDHHPLLARIQLDRQNRNTHSNNEG